jgi:phosphoribosylanthranilate isomerase
MTQHPVEIKICGLTTPEAAVACAAAGADCLGFVFHPPSPRHLTIPLARAIAAALPTPVIRVGVFVHQDAAEILGTADAVGLQTVQLHGACSAAICAELLAHGLHVVQKLSGPAAGWPAASRAIPPAAGLLVECTRGTLPGGNGTPWNWSDAVPLGTLRPFAVAGGLDPANVATALRASGASAVDVSSGVEATPGVKDLQKVATFIAAVRAAAVCGQGPVFRPAATIGRGIATTTPGVAP